MKLGEISINGATVSVFKPPHNEPDFPWVDMEELARAFMPEVEAKRMVDIARKYGGDIRAYATARNGDRIVVIVCHAIAQGFVGMIDSESGHRGEPEDGPAHRAYSTSFAVFAADRWKLSFGEMIHAFKNPGGEFLRHMNDSDDDPSAA